MNARFSELFYPAVIVVFGFVGVSFANGTPGMSTEKAVPWSKLKRFRCRRIEKRRKLETRMTQGQAEEIAELINDRNQLQVRYTTERVFRDSDLYEYEVLNDRVVACVQRKEVQWYQWEILHLSVREEHEGKGFAYKVYKRAEDKASANQVCLLQCTIREGNVASETFFTRQQFTKVNRFENERTGNTVGVWQKVLSQAVLISKQT